MKKTTLFAVLIFICTAVPAAAQARVPVVDVNGLNVMVFFDYYMAPASSVDGGLPVDGGGLTFDAFGSCPLNIFQERISSSYGTTWRFYPPELSLQAVVYVSTELHILSHLPSNCPELPVWTVHPNDGTANALAIQTGCKPRSYFRIEPVNPPIYKLTAILSDEDLVITAYDLIIREEGGKRLLVVNNDTNSSPLLVVFTRVSPRVTV